VPIADLDDAIDRRVVCQTEAVERWLQVQGCELAVGFLTTHMTRWSKPLPVGSAGSMAGSDFCVQPGPTGGVFTNPSDQPHKVRTKGDL